MECAGPFRRAAWGLKDSFRVDLLGLRRREPPSLEAVRAFVMSRFSLLSQQQALKGPLAKLNGIGHAIRSEHR